MKANVHGAAGLVAVLLYHLLRCQGKSELNIKRLASE